MFKILRGELDPSVIRSNLHPLRCCSEHGVAKVVHDALKGLEGREREEVLDDIVITLAFFCCRISIQGRSGE